MIPEVKICPTPANHAPLIVLSDIHLGKKSSSADMLYEFLEHYTCDTLVLNGDIIDGWVLTAKRHRKFPEMQKRVIDLINARILQKFPDYEFFIYSPENQSEQDNDNLHFRPASQKFMRDVEDCEGVICGAGFELPTEVIHLGKKLLVKAMGGQPEQASNALAIEKLGLGTVMTTVDENSIRNWLNSGKTRQIIFPDTAHDVAQWIAEGDWGNCESLVKKLWQKTIG